MPGAARSDRKKSDSESAAQRGTESSAEPVVSFLGGVLPPAAEIHNVLTGNSPARPTLVTTKATHRPSGDSTGSAGTSLSTTSSALTTSSKVLRS
jgi:hypothetical protein